MTVELVTESLENAILSQGPSEGLIMHTDLGAKYTSEAFQNQLKKHKMIHHLVVKFVLMTMPVLNPFTLL